MDASLSVRPDTRFELSNCRVGWDEALGLLGAIWDMPRVRATVSLGGMSLAATDWASLEWLDAVDHSVKFRIGGLTFSVVGAHCDRITAETWDHGLCKALVFSLGRTDVTVEGSWWQVSLGEATSRP
jgi:hypothetical protein